MSGFKTDVLLALPFVYKISHRRKFYELINLAIDLGVDGFLIRSLEELGTIDEIVDKTYLAVLDSNLYNFNKWAVEEFEKIRLQNVKLDGFSSPLELNNKELVDVIDSRFELSAYTRAPLMISEQCPKKTFDKCNKKLENYIIRSSKKEEYIVKSVCPFCYMEMNKDVINILDTDEILNLNYGHLRIGLEKEEDLLNLTRYFDAFDNAVEVKSKNSKDKKEIVEYGHFYRGVE